MEVGRLTASDPDLGENALLEFAIMDSEEAEIFNLTRKDKEAVIVLSKVLNIQDRDNRLRVLRSSQVVGKKSEIPESSLISWVCKSTLNCLLKMLLPYSTCIHLSTGSRFCMSN